MYSRRFNDQGIMPPPDYSGVTYRQKEEKQPTSEEKIQNAARVVEEDLSSIEAKREPRTREERRIRRPIYRSPRGKNDVNPTMANQRKEEHDKENEKGLLSGLFSLTGKKFSMEDIVLAGLLLLMMSDREKEGVDGEILLILGLLLLTK